jgi:hypothetical protein
MPAREHSLARIVVSAVVLGYLAYCCWHPEWMALMGVGLLGFWFIDTRAVLAVSDAHAMGVPPNAPNPFDLFGQPNPYPDAWFNLHYLHLTRADFTWVGAVLAAAFVAFALLRARPRSGGEAAWLCAILCSPAVVFAINRGNVDLLIFVVLSAVVLCLQSPTAAVRWLAVLGILLATAMKYYPAAALLILLAPTRPRRERGLQLAATALLLAVFIVTEWSSIVRYSAAPRPAGFFTLGFGIAPHLLGWSRGTVFLLLGLFAVGAIRIWRTAPPSMASQSPDEAGYLAFILGAVVLVSCYFATINYGYRMLCVIWMAPYLWHTATAKDREPRRRRLPQVIGGLTLLLLWCDAVCCLVINVAWKPTAHQVDSWTDRLTLWEQPLWAALIVLLLGFLVPFVRDGVRSLFRETAV